LSITAAEQHRKKEAARSTKIMRNFLRGGLQGGPKKDTALVGKKKIPSLTTRVRKKTLAPAKFTQREQRMKTSHAVDRNDDSSSEGTLLAPVWKGKLGAKTHRGQKQSVLKKPIRNQSKKVVVQRNLPSFGFTKAMRGMTNRRHREDITVRRDYSGTFVQATP
jgi:hypothetical protein